MKPQCVETNANWRLSLDDARLPIAKASASKAQNRKWARKGQNRIRSLDIEATLAESDGVLTSKDHRPEANQRQHQSERLDQCHCCHSEDMARRVLMESALVPLWNLAAAPSELRLVDVNVRHVADDGDDDHISQAEQRRNHRCGVRRYR